jgi:hypothetical protein
MIFICLSLLIAIIGLLMYLLGTHGKVYEVGRIMFFVGLLAFLLVGGGWILVVK